MLDRILSGLSAAIKVVAVGNVVTDRIIPAC